MDVSVTWEAIGILLSLATLPGTIELFSLTAASIFWKSAPGKATSSGSNIAVVIPAHNEAAAIQECLGSLLACGVNPPRAHLIVIADNCTDQTSRKAAEMGARVMERTDPENRGKGHALSYTFRKLLAEPFDAFIVLDADSVVEKNFIDCFATLFSRGEDAVQCRYLPDAPDESSRSRLMNLALLAFHVIRPRGRAKLGFSSGIFGNGFGLSRHALETVPYHPGSIAEDLEYHISLVRHGVTVVFEDNTTVRTLFPHDESTASVQRSRWEGGRFRVMIGSVPYLIQDLFQGKSFCLEVLFDLLTLPLGYHVTLIVLSAVPPSVIGRIYASLAIGIVAFHVISAIVTAGSRQDLKALLIAPFYILWKIARLPLILKTSGKNATWVRTPRHEKRKVKIP